MPLPAIFAIARAFGVGSGLRPTVGGGRISRQMPKGPSPMDIPKGVSLSIDEKELKMSIQRVSVEMGEINDNQKDYLFDVMSEEWGNLAGDILMITPPFDSGGGINAGKEAVKATIHTAFKPLNSIPFASLVRAGNWSAVSAYGFSFQNPKYQKYLESGNWKQLARVFEKHQVGDLNEAANAQNIIRTVTNKLHKSVRNPTNGRWNGSMYYVGGKNAPSQIAAFAKSAAKNVGLMGSGWASCHRKLKGKRNIPSVKDFGSGNVYKIPFGRGKKGRNSATVSISNTHGNWNGWLGRVKAMEYKNLIDSAKKTIISRFYQAKIQPPK